MPYAWQQIRPIIPYVSCMHSNEPIIVYIIIKYERTTEPYPCAASYTWWKGFFECASYLSYLCTDDVNFRFNRALENDEVKVTFNMLSKSLTTCHTKCKWFYIISTGWYHASMWSPAYSYAEILLFVLWCLLLKIALEFIKSCSVVLPHKYP